MSATTYNERKYGGRASPRRRAASFLLALVLEILLLLAFFTINFRERRKPEFEGGRLTTFDVSAESEADRSAAPQKPSEATPAPTRPPRPVRRSPRPGSSFPNARCR